MMHKLAILAMLALLAGCSEISRDNPNDPGSNRYVPYGATSIRTLRNGTGEIPIRGVTVRLGHNFAVTDSDGYATFDHLLAVNQTAIFEHESYLTDSLPLEVIANKAGSYVKMLKKLPEFVEDSTFFYSELAPNLLDSNSLLNFVTKIQSGDNSLVIHKVWAKINGDSVPLAIDYPSQTNWKRVYRNRWYMNVIGDTCRFFAEDTINHVRIAKKNPNFIFRVFLGIPSLFDVVGTLTNCNVSWRESVGDNYFNYILRITFVDISPVNTQQTVYTFYRTTQQPNFTLNLLQEHPTIQTSTFSVSVAQIDEYGNVSSSDSRIATLR